MHEFSLAQNIIEIVTESAKSNGKNKVVRIILEIGEISGVEKKALLTALESIKVGTITSEATLEIISTKGKAKCQDCQKIYPIGDLYSLCPTCGSYAKEIISGREFNVKSIEAE